MKELARGLLVAASLTVVCATVFASLFPEMKQYVDLCEGPNAPPTCNAPPDQGLLPLFPILFILLGVLGVFSLGWMVVQRVRYGPSVAKQEGQETRKE